MVPVTTKFTGWLCRVFKRIICHVIRDSSLRPSMLQFDVASSTETASFKSKRRDSIRRAVLKWPTMCLAFLHRRPIDGVLEIAS
ncbi:hypothetical protein MRX96_036062 [Rhipicephalus microplus]